jgi:hypothetical protein
MKELITLDQANHLMLALLIAAPIIGLLVGFICRRPLPGFLVGTALGAGNYVLWTVYSALTDRMGLDTVKNLLVNLALFVAVGVVVGSCVAWYQTARAAKDK